MLDTESFIAYCEGNCEAVLRFLGQRGVVSLVDQGAGRLTVEVCDIHARA